MEKKTTTKKAPVKKVTEKPATKKAPEKKTVKKPAVKKTATKKPVAKKTPAEKADPVKQAVINAGEMFKKIRVGKKLSISELSKMSKVTRTAISKFENGKVVPQLSTVLKIANALGYDIVLHYKTGVDCPDKIK